MDIASWDANVRRTVRYHFLKYSVRVLKYSLCITDLCSRFFFAFYHPEGVPQGHIKHFSIFSCGVLECRKPWPSKQIPHHQPSIECLLNSFDGHSTHTWWWSMSGWNNLTYQLNELDRKGHKWQVSQKIVLFKVLKINFLVFRIV